MASGRSVKILQAGESSVVTARLVDNQLLVDAKLGATAVELKDNTLTHKPRGWDWQADDSNFEIVNEHGNPVFQLTYLIGNTAVVRGVFFDEAKSALIFVGEQDMLWETATAADIEPLRIKPIFKYPSWKHPHER